MGAVKEAHRKGVDPAMERRGRATLRIVLAVKEEKLKVLTDALAKLREKVMVGEVSEWHLRRGEAVRDVLHCFEESAELPELAKAVRACRRNNAPQRLIRRAE